MGYSLEFHPSALKEWNELDPSIKRRLGQKLEKRLQHPRNAQDALRGELAGCYKLRDSTSGFRLIYEVCDDTLVVLVLAANKRERLKAYHSAMSRRD